MTQYANAYPQKRLFVEMFTRDLSLEDCLLDLVDNSIDAIFRHKQVDFGKEIWALAAAEAPRNLKAIPTVDIALSETRVSVLDDCGGIPYSLARNDVFNFGHDPLKDIDPSSRRLGAYGIGLKRALFKIGNHFAVTSYHNGDAFRVSLDIPAWVKQGSDQQAWRIPIAKIPQSPSKRGETVVEVTKLHDDIKTRLRDPAFAEAMHRMISQTYSLFLQRFVTVRLNDRAILPEMIPIGGSSQIEPAIDQFEQEGVSVRLFASLAARDKRGQWKSELAGWYVFCNGRAVMFADKTAVTGWGSFLPHFNTKMRGFVGLVFFQAADPLKLPWTTTKQGLNQEAAVFQAALPRMGRVGRQVVSFIDKMYPSDPEESPEERELAEHVHAIDIRNLAVEKPRRFEAKPSRTRSKNKVNVQYTADRDELDRLRRHLKQPDWSAGKLGRYALDFVLGAEGLK